MLLLLAVAAAVIALVTTLTLHQFLVGRLDGDLRATSGLFQRLPPPGALPPGPLPGPSDPGFRGPRPPDSLLARIDGGRVVDATVYTREGEVMPVPPDEYAALTELPVDGRPASRQLGELGGYRLLAVTLPGRGVVVTGLSEAPVVATMARLQTTELAVTVLTLLGAGLAGAWVVRRELHPLERVAVAAAWVSTQPLDRGEVSLVERVPDTDPGTEVGTPTTTTRRPCSR